MAADLNPGGTEPGPWLGLIITALGALGVEVADCWMIGDSPPNDIAAAAAIGMRTCWMAPVGRSAVGIAPTARVARFDQVPMVLAA